ncbi:MAG: hypothetical protein RMI78_00470 [Nitrososphaerota archaeon]|nr:hypothetical protein [Nitrososphaerota archaeon]
MPKRVVIKDSDIEGEAEPVIEPVEEKVEEVSVELPTPEAGEPKSEDRELEAAIVDAEAAYELVISKAEEIRVREQVTQKRFLESDEMNISILKKLIQKWDAMRDELMKNIRDAIDRYNHLRTIFEQKFSLIEEELYFNQVELDTIYQLEEQGKPISVSKKEELEKLIPELREKLVEITQRIKEIDAKIDQLRKMTEGVYETTSYKDFSERLFDQIVNTLQHRYADIEEARVKIRSQIEFLAQREGIPKEYATIYLWKRLKKSG